MSHEDFNQLSKHGFARAVKEITISPEVWSQLPKNIREWKPQHAQAWLTDVFHGSEALDEYLIQFNKFGVRGVDLLAANDAQLKDFGITAQIHVSRIKTYIAQLINYQKDYDAHVEKEKQEAINEKEYYEMERQYEGFMKSYEAQNPKKPYQLPFNISRWARLQVYIFMKLPDHADVLSKYLKNIAREKIEGKDLIDLITRQDSKNSKAILKKISNDDSETARLLDTIKSYAEKLAKKEKRFKEEQSKKLSEGIITFRGAFNKQQMLGKGAYSKVYLAEDREKATRKLVIKILSRKNDNSESLRHDVLHEARMLYQARGPGVVQLYGVMAGMNDEPSLVLEYAVYGSLEVELKCLSEESIFHDRYIPNLQQKELGIANPVFYQKVRIAKEIASALARIHSVGIVHLDIAGRNILLDSRKRPKISDFGLAMKEADVKTLYQRQGYYFDLFRYEDNRDEMVKERMEEDEEILENKYLLPMYERTQSKQRSLDSLPHWVLSDDKPPLYDRSIDVYQFGCLMYELLTCRLPHAGVPTEQILLLKKQKLGDPDINGIADVDPQFLEIMTQCWTEPTLLPSPPYGNQKGATSMHQIYNQLTSFHVQLTKTGGNNKQSMTSPEVSSFLDFFDFLSNQQPVTDNSSAATASTGSEISIDNKGMDVLNAADILSSISLTIKPNYVRLVFPDSIKMHPSTDTKLLIYEDCGIPKEVLFEVMENAYRFKNDSVLFICLQSIYLDNNYDQIDALGRCINFLGLLGDDEHSSIMSDNVTHWQQLCHMLVQLFVQSGIVNLGNLFVTNKVLEEKFKTSFSVSIICTLSTLITDQITIQSNLENQIASSAISWASYSTSMSMGPSMSSTSSLTSVQAAIETVHDERVIGESWIRILKQIAYLTVKLIIQIVSNMQGTATSIGNEQIELIKYALLLMRNLCTISYSFVKLFYQENILYYCLKLIEYIPLQKLWNHNILYVLKLLLKFRLADIVDCTANITLLGGLIPTEVMVSHSSHKKDPLIAYEVVNVGSLYYDAMIQIIKQCLQQNQIVIEPTVVAGNTLIINAPNTPPPVPPKMDKLSQRLLEKTLYALYVICNREVNETIALEKFLSSTREDTLQLLTFLVQKFPTYFRIQESCMGIISAIINTGNRALLEHNHNERIQRLKTHKQSTKQRHRQFSSLRDSFSELLNDDEEEVEENEASEKSNNVPLYLQTMLTAKARLDCVLSVDANLSFVLKAMEHFKIDDQVTLFNNFSTRKASSNSSSQVNENLISKGMYSRNNMTQTSLSKLSMSNLATQSIIINYQQQQRQFNANTAHDQADYFLQSLRDAVRLLDEDGESLTAATLQKSCMNIVGITCNIYPKFQEKLLRTPYNEYVLAAFTNFPSNIPLIEYGCHSLFATSRKNMSHQKSLHQLTIMKYLHFLYLTHHSVWEVGNGVICALIGLLEPSAEVNRLMKSFSLVNTFFGVNVTAEDMNAAAAGTKKLPGLRLHDLKFYQLQIKKYLGYDIVENLMHKENPQSLSILEDLSIYVYINLAKNGNMSKKIIAQSNTFNNAASNSNNARNQTSSTILLSNFFKLLHCIFYWKPILLYDFERFQLEDDRIPTRFISQHAIKAYDDREHLHATAKKVAKWIISATNKDKDVKQMNKTATAVVTEGKNSSDPAALLVAKGSKSEGVDNDKKDEENKKDKEKIDKSAVSAASPSTKSFKSDETDSNKKGEDNKKDKEKVSSMNESSKKSAQTEEKKSETVVATEEVPEKFMKYMNMKKILPEGAVQHAMKRDGLSDEEIEYFFNTYVVLDIQPAGTNNSDPTAATAVATPNANTNTNKSSKSLRSTTMNSNTLTATPEEEEEEEEEDEDEKEKTEQLLTELFNTTSLTQYIHLCLSKHETYQDFLALSSGLSLITRITNLHMEVDNYAHPIGTFVPYYENKWLQEYRRESVRKYETLKLSLLFIQQNTPVIASSDMGGKSTLSTNRDYLIVQSEEIPLLVRYSFWLLLIYVSELRTEHIYKLDQTSSALTQLLSEIVSLVNTNQNTDAADIAAFIVTNDVIERAMYYCQQYSDYYSIVCITVCFCIWMEYHGFFQHRNFQSLLQWKTFLTELAKKPKSDYRLLEDEGYDTFLINEDHAIFGNVQIHIDKLLRLIDHHLSSSSQNIFIFDPTEVNPKRMVEKNDGGDWQEMNEDGTVTGGVGMSNGEYDEYDDDEKSVNATFLNTILMNKQFQKQQPTAMWDGVLRPLKIYVSAVETEEDAKLSRGYVYVVEIQWDEQLKWRIAYRFKYFAELQDHLEKEFESVHPPPIFKNKLIVPTFGRVVKTFLSRSAGFLESRRQLLQQWFNEILTKPVVLFCHAFLAFCDVYNHVQSIPIFPCTFEDIYLNTNGRGGGKDGGADGEAVFPVNCICYDEIESLLFVGSGIPTGLLSFSSTKWRGSLKVYSFRSIGGGRGARGGASTAATRSPTRTASVAILSTSAIQLQTLIQENQQPVCTQQYNTMVSQVVYIWARKGVLVGLASGSILFYTIQQQSTNSSTVYTLTYAGEIDFHTKAITHLLVHQQRRLSPTQQPISLLVSGSLCKKLTLFDLNEDVSYHQQGDMAMKILSFAYDPMENLLFCGTDTGHVLVYEIAKPPVLLFDLSVYHCFVTMRGFDTEKYKNKQVPIDAIAYDCITRLLYIAYDCHLVITAMHTQYIQSLNAKNNITIVKSMTYWQRLSFHTKFQIQGMKLLHAGKYIVLSEGSGSIMLIDMTEKKDSAATTTGGVGKKSAGYTTTNNREERDYVEHILLSTSASLSTWEEVIQRDNHTIRDWLRAKGCDCSQVLTREDLLCKVMEIEKQSFLSLAKQFLPNTPKAEILFSWKVTSPIYHQQKNNVKMPFIRTMEYLDEYQTLAIGCSDGSVQFISLANILTPFTYYDSVGVYASRSSSTVSNTANTAKGSSSKLLQGPTKSSRGKRQILQ